MAIIRWSSPSWIYAPTIPNGSGLAGAPSGVGYGWANIGPDGAQPTSAAFDGAKDGGPNSGARTNTFGEDLRSAYANRAIRFLYENSDQFDEWLNADHPSPALLTITVSGVASSTITVPAGVYLGMSGDTLNATNLQKVLRLLDSNKDELAIWGVGGPVQVVAQSASLATVPNPPYSATSFTVTLSQSIPVGTYYLLCATYSALSLLSRAALVAKVPESGARVPGVLHRSLLELRGDENTWLTAWPTSIHVLLRRGLNGLYRNGSVLEGTPAALQPYHGEELTDAAASGGFYLRDGAAMLGYANKSLVDDSIYHDTFGALWGAWAEDTGPGDGVDEPVAGTRGFVFVGQRPLAISSSATAQYAPALGGLACFVAHKDTHSGYTAVPTYIDPTGATCSLQRVSGQDKLTLTEAGNYFRKTISGTPRSSVVKGHTFLEVEWNDPNDPLSPGNINRRLYRVMEILSDTSVRVARADGSYAGFPSSLTGGTVVRWLTQVYATPDGASELQTRYSHPDAALLESGSLWCVSSPIHTQTTADQVTPGQGAYFGAYENVSTAYALRWGGYSRTLFQYQTLAYLRGDGGITCQGVSCTTLLAASSVTCASLSVSGSSQFGDITCDDIDADEIVCNVLTADVATIDILTASETNTDNLSAGQLLLTTTGVTDATNGNHALNLTTALGAAVHAVVTITGSLSNYTGITLPAMGSGRRFTVSFVHTTAGHLNVGAWPVACKFADPADQLLSGAVGAVDTFEGVKLPNGNIQMSVRRYLWACVRCETTPTPSKTATSSRGSRWWGPGYRTSPTPGPMRMCSSSGACASPLLLPAS